MHMYYSGTLPARLQNLRPLLLASFNCKDELLLLLPSSKDKDLRLLPESLESVSFVFKQGSMN
jgi:hypothetical protein